MDHEVDIVGECKPDDFQQDPGVVRSDCEDLGWVGVGVQVDDGEGMFEGVEDGSHIDAVLVS